MSLFTRLPAYFLVLAQYRPVFECVALCVFHPKVLALAVSQPSIKSFLDDAFDELLEAAEAHKRGPLHFATEVCVDYWLTRTPAAIQSATVFVSFILRASLHWPKLSRDFWLKSGVRQANEALLLALAPTLTAAHVQSSTDVDPNASPIRLRGELLTQYDNDYVRSRLAIVRLLLSLDRNVSTEGNLARALHRMCMDMNGAIDRKTSRYFMHGSVHRDKLHIWQFMVRFCVSYTYTYLVSNCQS